MSDFAESDFGGETPPEKKGRGGKREGAGRAPKQTPAAVQLVEAIEGFLVGKAGPAWKATDAEKNNIANAVSGILKSLGAGNDINPYAALVGGCALYAFGGRDRLSGKDVGNAIAAKIKKKTPKEKAADATAAAAAAETPPPPSK